LLSFLAPQWAQQRLPNVETGLDRWFRLTFIFVLDRKNFGLDIRLELNVTLTEIKRL
jgi:hypothetical protein